MSLSEKFDEGFIQENFDVISDITFNWVDGIEISILRDEWVENFKNTDNEDKFNVFIEEVFAYKYPWGISMFLLIFAKNINKEIERFPSDIRNLPSFVKYGLNSEVACWARAVGVPTREISQLVALNYIQSETDNRFVNFIYWLANLSHESLINDFQSLNEYELDNLNRVIQKLVVKRTSQEELSNIQCEVKGIPYQKERKTLSKSIKIGEALTLIRELENPYDIYAIKVNWNNKNLGYIPRDLARRLAIRMDLFGETFSAKVTNKIFAYDYSKIEITINQP